jgi:DNA-binding response OmpR family regulator
MRALIVESNDALGHLWQRHLERLKIDVLIARTGKDALALIHAFSFDVIVLDLMLADESAMTVADIAGFRQPKANVVFVTDTTFFSDGSIFCHSANARAFIKSNTAPADLAAIVQHYGSSRDHAGHQSLAPG